MIDRDLVYQDHLRFLRARKGFALFWWWRVFSSLALIACRFGAPPWVSNFLGAIAAF